MNTLSIGSFAAATAAAIIITCGCAAGDHPRPGPAPKISPAKLDSSIGKGIRFLLARQNANGSWGSPRNTKGRNIYAPVPSAHHGFRVAITGLCVSALIEAGGDGPAVAKSIKRGEAYLAENLPKLKRSALRALYNNWAHAYGLRALVRMYNRVPGDKIRRKQILKLAAGQIDFLKRFESLGGGWGYYEFDYHTQKPFGLTTSFLTASVLVALIEVRSIGVKVPQGMIDRAKARIVNQQNPNFTYTYSRSWTKRRAGSINRPAGSLGRSQVCNLALRVSGDPRITDKVLRTWLDWICARNGWLSRARKFPRPHESWFAVAGYFYYYGHFYAAGCIEQIPKRQRGFYQDHLAGILMPLQEKDGSWWDFPLYDYHQQYGTAMAIMALHRCRRGGVRGEVKKAKYSNPVIDEIGPADPHVILHKGKYYLYPTGDNWSYHVYTSTDLVNWTKGPRVFSPGKKNVWAPDVFHNPADKKFYLYYTVGKTIGVAVSGKPDGKFVNRGLLFKSAIDAHMFRDDDGKLYLYYVQLPGFRIRVQRMKDLLHKDNSEPIQLIKPTESWETKRGRVTEGPWMLKHKGTYYLMYSGTGANSLDYAVGYATSKSPTGPFVKHKGNPIIKRGRGALGPGHGCVVRDSAGKMWHVYHQQKDGSRPWNRFICIDPLWFDAEGVLHGKATRKTPQPAPTPLP